MKSLDLSAWIDSAFHPVHSTPKTSPRYSFEWKKFLTRFVAEFVEFAVSPQEPRVWQTHDRQGEVCWHAYDPITNRAFACESESEMRQWLEERYYYTR